MAGDARPREPRRGPLAVLGAVLAPLVGLAVPLGVGLLGGIVVGGSLLGLLAVVTLGAVAAVWWARVVLATVWWVHSGRWEWRRMSLRRSLAAGRHR